MTYFLFEIFIFTKRLVLSQKYFQRACKNYTDIFKSGETILLEPIKSWNLGKKFC